MNTNGHNMRLIIISILLVALTSACADVSEVEDSPPAASVPTGQTAPASQRDEVLRVVTTTNIVADWVQAVGHDRVDVFALLPSGADPHTFRPGAQDIARVADAELVLTVGLNLEAAWLHELVESAANDPDSIVALGDVADPIEFVALSSHDDDIREDDDHDNDGEEDHDNGDEHDHDNGDGDDHEHGALDPHFWFDPLRVKRAVNDIAARLSVLQPNQGDFFRENAARFNAQLNELHTWIEGQVASVPPDDRKLVTSHDSFRYLADRYGFEIVGAILPGGSTEREPSAQEMAELIVDLKKTGTKAVFAETSISDKLALRIAQEAGVDVIAGLYTGSLGGAGSGPTYLAFMRYNVATIVEALK